jgi:predicted acylesterase/phospholipase RssA
MNALNKTLTMPTTIAVSVERGVDLPAAALSALLAEAFGELVPAAVVEIDRAMDPDCALADARQRGAGSEYVFVAIDANDRRGAAIASKTSRRVVFAHGDAAVAPTHDPSTLRVVVGDHLAPSLAPATRGLLSMVRRRASTWSRDRDRERGAVRVVAYEDLAPWAACRARLHSREHLTSAPHHLAQLSEESRESLRRCARALTGRRVGVALGGAGAWGYAGAALILELLNRGVPIDMVAGASSGALIGAYYCAAGKEGIERVIRRGPELARSMWMMALSSSVVEMGVDADLGGARLESLDVPLLPIVSNLARRRAEVVVEGSAALGVRASVSAPGIFAPTVIGDQTYVDGAVSDNVPTALLESMGAGLVISGNFLPAATMRPARARERARSRIARVVRELDPFARMNDFAVAFQLFMHNAGNAEPSPRRITYTPEAVAFPLVRTFQYGDAERMVDAARNDPRLHEAVESARRAWSASTSASRSRRV